MINKTLGLTLDQLKLLSYELDFEVETEHRKGSEFYASGFYEFTEDDREYILKCELNPDEIIGLGMQVMGYWSDYDGCEWYEYYLVKKEVTHIPEKVEIIPAHDIVSWVKV